MDRRSWLWRRKSSDKSPSGETESSGSISSHSERFSDDQAIPNHSAQSPEVTSKAISNDEELNDNVKALSAKLSEALVNIRAKEDLVKQHAKVAEEAVSGWEKAEAEVLTLKKQADAAAQKNLVLEERVIHLDGALKECLRQLRLAREEQEQKTLEAKSELEKQLSSLQSELQSAKAESLLVSDLRAQLESTKKENAELKVELFSKTEELMLRTSERDLSAMAAESASKQHLESIRKVAKLEGECRRLKALAHKAASSTDQKSVAASSAYVESFTDSQSDSGDRFSGIENDQTRSDLWASSLAPSSDMNLMDDFLEMERLAALHETDSENTLEIGACSGELSLKVELEAMTNRTAELEEKLDNMEAEKTKLEKALFQCQFQLKMSNNQLKETEVKLIELKAELALANEAKTASVVEFQTATGKLKKLTEHLDETEVNMIELQTKLDMEHEARKRTEAELEDTNLKLKKTEVCLEEANVGLSDLNAQFSTEKEDRIAVQQELESANLQLKKSTERLERTEAKLLELQTELERTNEIRCSVESELVDSNEKKVEAESQLKATESKLQSLNSRVHSLEEELKKEKAFSQESIVKLKKLESLQNHTTIGKYKFNQDKELAVAASKFEECKKTIDSIGRQLRTLSTLEDFMINS